MENNQKDYPEFDLDDILKEFGTEEQAAPAPEAEAAEQPSVQADVLQEENIPPQEEPEAEAPEAAPEEVQQPQEEAQRVQQMPDGQEGEAPQEDTQRFDLTEEPGEPSRPAEEDTKNLDELIDELTTEAAREPETQEEATEPQPKILYNPRTRLRELKKKLVAGPERRYYELSEKGVGKLQLAILLNALLVLLCAGGTTLFTLGLVPESRLRFTIFTQILAMLISAFLGCNQILDGIGDIFKGRFGINSLLVFTFAACCADGFYCLTQLRVPCCAAFSLEMMLALQARYHRYSTELAQMDTMRKAVRLNALVRTENCLDGKTALLRRDGEVEDFMDTYTRPSGPERVQSIYCLISLLVCVAIAALAGMKHGTQMAVQILATSLLVAVPASFFIAVTRPMAVLEKRLHMVGTVLCGWQGVKQLSKKAVFPIFDTDLFPQGSTKLNGVKFYGDRDPVEVVSYSASLIFAADGGLVPVFRQLLTSRGGTEYAVANFQDYGTGGVGGEIQGEPVLLGSLEFLRSMGIQIPEGSMVSQAVYAAIDGKLCAVYAISYAKMRSASAGLVTLCGSRRIMPAMACDDFMVTPEFLAEKFQVKTKRLTFLHKEQRQALKTMVSDPESPALALVTREELISYGYAVTGAKALKTATRLGVAIHLLGGILGLLIMAALAYLGSTELLTPTNVLLYQLVWLIPGWLITEWTRAV